VILTLFPKDESPVSYSVDFVNVSTVGLESSSVVDALAGLRANEAQTSGSGAVADPSTW
jgi:hypothetical protein